ncbi:unnamed protein product [Phyllotreta striolata]|uniref:carbonyl reductase (NADPH) n=1 Tax=Phyllotreta striolata TaxID=444603 RepID=A0A9N9TYF4_PHYSR|nr:unnamed protein product [Phyllotreta striolata]
MSLQKVAVVTGANKGIGYEIARGLCKRFEGIVYLTARDEQRGLKAVKQLEAENLKPRFHQLDITQQASIDKFKDYIAREHGGLDLLVNNAAIAFKNNSPAPVSQQAKETLEVNYFSTLRFCEALFPLLRNNARVVNVSSSAGHLSRIPSEEKRKEFSRPDLTVPELSRLMEKFIQDAENGSLQQEGWGNSTYVVSKVGLSSLTIIQQRLFDEEQPSRNVSVNSVHPGWVKTDMSSYSGNKTSEEGAQAPLWLALDAQLKGQYVWDDCSVVDWYAQSTPNKP